MSGTEVSPQGEQSAKSELLWMHGLRALAALEIVRGHALEIALGSSASKSIHALGLVWISGHDAVSLFIMLSGFALAFQSLRRGGLPGGAWGFFQRRYRRILPPLYAAILLSCAVAWLTHSHITRQALLSHVFVVNNLVPIPASPGVNPVNGNTDLNPPLWSVAVECQIYLWFPLLLLAWRRWGVIRASLAVFGLSEIAATATIWATSWPVNVQGAHLHYYGFFALGAMAAWIAFSDDAHAQKVRSLPWGAIAAILTLAAHAVSDIIALPTDPAVRRPLCDWLYAAWVPACLIWLSNRDSWLSRLLSSRWLVHIGRFAYSVYLVHYPILAAIWLFGVKQGFTVGDPLSAATYMVVITPAVLLGSLAFYKLAEERFTKPPQRVFRFRRSQEATVPAASERVL